MVAPLSGSISRRPAPERVALVIPVFNEAQVLAELKKRLLEVIKQLPCDFQLIFVDDGSRDETPTFLERWAQEDSRVGVARLSRNFGHQAAISAGLDLSQADVTVIMDADLQDPPEVIPKMIEKYRDGFDIVYGRRSERRGETIFKRVSAFLFYRLMKLIIGKEFPTDAGDFRLLARPVVEAVQKMREGQRFLRSMIYWSGFKQTSVPFIRDVRFAGGTKFPTRRMFRFAVDAIFSFSTFPLTVSLVIGSGLCVFAFSYGGYALCRHLFYRNTVSGWTSLAILESLIGGATLMCLGLIGQYIGRIYQEQKGRPLYIIQDAWNLSNEKRGSLGTDQPSLKR